MATIVAFWVLLLIEGKGPFSLAVIDDAYIYLRVVENLIAGAGWVYNPGDPGNPLTSPLYALVLVGAAVATHPGPGALLAVYTTGLLAIAGLQYAALRARGRPFATLVAIVSSAGYVVAHAVGMETSLYLALVLATALAYQCRRFLLTGLLAGLVALARPEGIALAGLVGLLHLVAQRRILWRLVFGFALPVLPWLIFSWLSFGELLPHTVGVKAMQAQVGYWRLLGAWLPAFLRQPALPAVTYLVAAVGASWAVQEFRRGRAYPLIVMGFGALQVAGYSILRAPVGYFWYFAPGNLALDMAFVAGLFVAGRWLLDRWGRGPRPAPRGRLVLGFAVALLAANQLGASPWRKLRPYRLAADYAETGRWIAQATPPSARVACTEIGYLGFYSRRPIRDIHGLIHPEALPHIAREETDWWFTADPPELIVVHDPPWRGEPSPEWWPPASLAAFTADYAEVHALPTLKVYERRPRSAGGG